MARAIWLRWERRGWADEGHAIMYCGFSPRAQNGHGGMWRLDYSLREQVIGLYISIFRSRIGLQRLLGIPLVIMCASGGHCWFADPCHVTQLNSEFISRSGESRR